MCVCVCVWSRRGGEEQGSEEVREEGKKERRERESEWVKY